MSTSFNAAVSHIAGVHNKSNDYKIFVFPEDENLDKKIKDFQTVEHLHTTESFDFLVESLEKVETKLPNPNKLNKTDFEELKKLKGKPIYTAYIAYNLK